jgi:hypothetical protein
MIAKQPDRWGAVGLIALAVTRFIGSLADRINAVTTSNYRDVRNGPAGKPAAFIKFGSAS